MALKKKRLNESVWSVWLHQLSLQQQQNKSGTHKKIKDFNKQKRSELSKVIINEGIEAGNSLESFRTST